MDSREVDGMHEQRAQSWSALEALLIVVPNHLIYCHHATMIIKYRHLSKHSELIISIQPW